MGLAAERRGASTPPYMLESSFTLCTQTKLFPVKSMWSGAPLKKMIGGMVPEPPAHYKEGGAGPGMHT